MQRGGCGLWAFVFVLLAARRPAPRAEAKTPIMAQFMPSYFCLQDTSTCGLGSGGAS